MPRRRGSSGVAALGEAPLTGCWTFFFFFFFLHSIPDCQLNKQYE